MANQLRSGYLMAELTITDPDIFYDDYMTLVTPILKKYRAKFLAGTSSPKVVEGGRSVQRIVLIEFESLLIAEDFYYSPEYQAVIGYRQRSSSSHLYLFEGLP